MPRASRRPLVPARCVLEADGRYRLSVEEPLEPDPTLPPRERTRELTARLAAVYERWIRAAPEQWAWHQPRWRTRPGEREILPLEAHRAARRARVGLVGETAEDPANR